MFSYWIKFVTGLCTTNVVINCVFTSEVCKPCKEIQKWYQNTHQTPKYNRLTVQYEIHTEHSRDQLLESGCLVCCRSTNSKVLITTKTLACPVSGNGELWTQICWGLLQSTYCSSQSMRTIPGKLDKTFKHFPPVGKVGIAVFFYVWFKPPCLNVCLLLTYLHRKFNSFVFYFVFCKLNKPAEKRLKRVVIVFSCFPWFFPSGTQPSWKALLVTGDTGPGVPAEISIGTRWRNRISYVQNSCLRTDSSAVTSCPLLLQAARPAAPHWWIYWASSHIPVRCVTAWHWFLVMIFCSTLQNLFFGRTAAWSLLVCIADWCSWVPLLHVLFSVCHLNSPICFGVFLWFMRNLQHLQARFVCSSHKHVCYYSSVWGNDLECSVWLLCDPWELLYLFNQVCISFAVN